MSAPELTGTLKKYHSNFYYVDVDSTVYECSVRGLLKKARKHEAAPELMVGDTVVIESVDAANQSARIKDVLPRRNTLTRPKIANVDQALIVYSLKQPDFDFTQLDRYLTHVEIAGIDPVICISKCDLSSEDNSPLLAEIVDRYQRRLGYPVLQTSVYMPAMIEAIRPVILGKTTVLAGPSGAGKSSLLNALKPELSLKVGEVSEKIERGQHTTRHVELLTLGDQTFIADTPGFSYLRFDQTLPVDIARHFREFQALETPCAFSDCLHHRPASDTGDEADASLAGCAVLDSDGQARAEVIHPSRYHSYGLMIDEAMTYKKAASESSQKAAYGYKTVSSKGKRDLSILRLSEKQRETSRRTQRQQLSSVDALAEEEALDD